MPIDPGELAAAIADLMGRGALPGLGSAQGDSAFAWDNVDATHALNIRYVIPSNVQRIVTARLSFHLAAYRTYTQTAAAGTHVHYWTFPGSTNAVTTSQLFVTGGGAMVTGPGPGAGVPSLNAGKQTSSEHAAAVGASVDAVIEAYDVSGHTHAQTLGVTEGATATNVTVKFDGVDKTTALGGGAGFTTDQVELDVTAYIQRTPDKAFHLIALTPSANGRIEAHLRLSYFANAGISA